MFAYCENDPVNKADPTGTIAITTLILIGSIAVGVGTALYTGYKMRQAGYDWIDTTFNAAGAGLCAFATVYTFGMSAYELYCNMSWYYGSCPATHIGGTQKQLQTAANTANSSISGKGPVVGSKKHTVFASEVNSVNNSRIATEVSYKNGQPVSYGTSGSIRFDVIQYNAKGIPIRAWDLKTGCAILSQSRIATMQARAGLTIPIAMIK